MPSTFSIFFLTTGLVKFVNGVETPGVGIWAFSFFTSGTAGGETEAGADVGVVGGGVGFGGGCANATIEAVATANMTIVLFITNPRPIYSSCQAV